MSVAALRRPSVQADRASIAASPAQDGSANSRQGLSPRWRRARNASLGTLQRTRRCAEDHVRRIALGVFGQIAEIVRDLPQVFDRRREIALAAAEDPVKTRKRAL